MDKPSARTEARAVRRAIAEREEKEARALRRLLDLPELRAANTVGCYVGVRSELDTRLALRGLFVRGVVVAVPAAPDARMRFVRLHHPWALVPGAYGIPEPRQPWDEVEGEALDAIVVPGLRFGRDGTRLGNGGGHFDRFLAEHPRARRIGLAFAEQVVDSVGVEEHDVHMDVLVTPDEVLRFPRQVS